MVSRVLENEWLEPETKRNLLRNRSVHVPQNKKNLVSAVELPHPGLSYNPSYTDHQTLLAKTLEEEKEKLKKEAKLRRATFTPKVVGDGSLPDVKEETEGEEEEEDEKKVRKLTKPKTKQQKRKEKEQREKELVAKKAKGLAIKESEVFRVKSLRKDIEAEEKKTKAKLAKKVEKKLEHEKFGTSRLSRFKFEEKESRPMLSDELAKGLIGTGGETGSTADLLLDRFKSLQKRNVIEPRVKQK